MENLVSETNKKIDFGFVILHYQAFDMTVNCVNALLALMEKSDFTSCIVVVDNFSPNGSGELLKKKFSARKNIEVILSNENFGFAKGNNLGYSYIKNNFDADFIIDINNDIIISQSDFLEKIKKIYQEKKFAVLGPDVYIPHLKLHQNPIRKESFTIDEAKSTIKRLERQLSHYRFVYVKNKFAPLKNKVKAIFGNYNPIDKSVENSPCVLHGSCYIFSKVFISKREYAFNPCTFMFYEEYILNYEVLKMFSDLDNAMLYSPAIMVEHNHSVSVNSIFSSKYKKHKWKDENCLESLRRFVEDINL